MGISVRRAEKQDAPTLLRLIEALASYEKLDPPSEEARARLLADGWGDRPRFEAWLVETDSGPAGYAIAFETYSTFLARPTLYLEDIFILPHLRGQGAGYALFRALAEDALERGCGRIEWACLDWNELGLRFYERMGARPLSEWIYFRLTREEMEQVFRSFRRPPG